MKRLLIITIFGVLSCQNNSTTQKELELERKEKELLARENAMLKQEKNQVDESFTPSMIEGSWTVHFMCSYSTCLDQFVQDDQFTEFWNISYSQGKVTAKVLNPKLKRILEYHGEFVDNVLRLKSEFTGFFKSADASCKMKRNLQLQPEGDLKYTFGPPNNPCEAQFSILLTRTATR